MKAAPFRMVPGAGPGFRVVCGVCRKTREVRHGLKDRETPTYTLEVLADGVIHPGPIERDEAAAIAWQHNSKLHHPGFARLPDAVSVILDARNEARRERTELESADRAARKEMAQALCAEGKSRREIAEELGLTFYQVKHMLEKMPERIPVGILPS